MQVQYRIHPNYRDTKQLAVSLRIEQNKMSVPCIRVSRSKVSKQGTALRGLPTGRFFLSV